MTCCLLVTLRLRPSRLLALRLGQRWRAWLVAIAGLELVAAWLLVRALLALSDSSRSDGPIMGLMESSDGGSWVALVLLLAATASGVAALRPGVAPRIQAYAAFVAYALVLLPNVMTAAIGSHVVAMAQTMLLVLLAPALLVSATANRQSRGHLGWALSAAAGYLAALYLWHLPAMHLAMMSDPGWNWIRVAGSAAIGLAFWAAARTKPAALIAAAGGSGLLGLALVIGPRPLYGGAMYGPAMNGFGLNALADQRLAGLLMMLVDVVVLIPTIARLLPTVDRMPQPSIHFQ